MHPDTQAIELRVNAARLVSVASSLRLVAEHNVEIAPYLFPMYQDAEQRADELRRLALHLDGARVFVHANPRYRARR